MPGRRCSSSYLHFKERTAERRPAVNCLQKGHLGFVHTHGALFVVRGGDSLKNKIIYYIEVWHNALIFFTRLMIFQHSRSLQAISSENWAPRTRHNGDSVTVGNLKNKAASILYFFLLTTKPIKKTWANKRLILLTSDRIQSTTCLIPLCQRAPLFSGDYENTSLCHTSDTFLFIFNRSNIHHSGTLHTFKRTTWV